MKTSKESQSDKVAKEQDKPANSKKSIVKDTDAEGSSPYVELDKANFSERPHGRTTRSLGPDHEPGTV
jgi:hypothetical protein